MLLPLTPLFGLLPLLAVFALPPALAAPLQAPFLADTSQSGSERDALCAGFSSAGRGIPVLHDVCSGHALLSSHAAGAAGTAGTAGAATVYVYHCARRGFCVALFAPDAVDVSVTVTASVAASVAAAAAPPAGSGAGVGGSVREGQEGDAFALDYDVRELEDEDGDGHGDGDGDGHEDGHEDGDEDGDKEGEGPQRPEGRQGRRAEKYEGGGRGGRDEAAWTGRGAMPGSLRVRSAANCVRVAAVVAGEPSDLEVCLGEP